MSKTKLYSFERKHKGQTLLFYFVERRRGEGQRLAQDMSGKMFLGDLVAGADIVLDASDNTFIKCRVPFEDLLNGAYDVESIE